MNRIRTASLLLIALLPHLASGYGEQYVPAYNELVRMLNERLLAAGHSETNDMKEAGEPVTPDDLSAMRTKVCTLMRYNYCMPTNNFDLSATGPDEAFPYGLRWDADWNLLEPSLMSGIGKNGYFTLVPGEYTESGQPVYGNGGDKVPLLWSHFEELKEALTRLTTVRVHETRLSWVSGGGSNHKGGGSGWKSTWEEAVRVATEEFWASSAVLEGWAPSSWANGSKNLHSQYGAGMRTISACLQIKPVLISKPCQIAAYNRGAIPYDGGPGGLFNSFGAAVRCGVWTNWCTLDGLSSQTNNTESLGKEAYPTTFGPEPEYPDDIGAIGYYIGDSMAVATFTNLYVATLTQPLETDSNDDGLVATACECIGDCMLQPELGWSGQDRELDLKIPLGISSGVKTGGARIKAYMTERFPRGELQQHYSLDTRVVGGYGGAAEEWHFAIVRRPSGREVLFSLKGSKAGPALYVDSTYVLTFDGSCAELTFPPQASGPGGPNGQQRAREQVVHRFRGNDGLIEVRVGDGPSEKVISKDRWTGWPGLRTYRDYPKITKVKCAGFISVPIYAGNIMSGANYTTPEGDALGSNDTETGSRIYNHRDAAGTLTSKTHVVHGADEQLVIHFGTERAQKRFVETGRLSPETVRVVRETRESSPDMPTTSNVTSRLLKAFPWGYEVVSETTAYGSPDAQTTTYSYHESMEAGHNYGQLALIEYPDGGWARFDQYDQNERPLLVCYPFRDSPPSATTNECRSFQYTYIDDDPRPFTSVERVMNRTVSQTTRSYQADRRRLDRYVRLGEDEPPIQQATTTFFVAAGTHKGRVETVQHPDGTETRYTYSYDSGRDELTTTTERGAVEDDVIVEGTRTITVTTGSGRTVTTRTEDIASGIVTASVRNEHDKFGHVVARINELSGLTNSYAYDCCGPSLITDEEGIETHLTYDSLKRTTTRSRLGVTELYAYDAFGQVAITSRFAGNVNRTNMVFRDDLGRVVMTTNSAGTVVRHTYATRPGGGTITTTVNPDGGEVIETTYRDGSLRSVSGSGTVPRFYDYGIDAIGTFTTEYFGTDTNATQWVRTYRDMLGRTIKTVFADGYETVTEYDRYGRVVREGDASVASLTEYDRLGRPWRRAIDMNGNGMIDIAGPDRITEMLSDYRIADETPVRATVTSIYPEHNEGAVAVATNFASVTGLEQWSTAFGRQSHNRTEYDPATRQRIETLTSPDGTRVVQEHLDGRPVQASLVSTNDSVIILSLTEYDPLGRIAATHTPTPNGTTQTVSYAYNESDQPTSIVVRAGAYVMTNQYAYDEMGRVIQMLRPDGGVVTSRYNTRGQLEERSGAGVYPVTYGYDNMGRLESLSTFREGLAGAADTTTWDYDDRRGWLTAKHYADRHGPSYTYHPNGQLATRTWARGIETRYDYNVAGALTNVSHSSGEPGTSFTYDRLGRVKTVTDAVGTRTNRYSLDGRLLSTTCPQAAGAKISYGWDALGRRTSLEFGGTCTTYAYGAFGQLDHITADTNEFTYAFGADGSSVTGRLTSVGGAPLLGENRRFDDIGRLETIASVAHGETVTSSTYVHDIMNRRTSQTFADGDAWNFGYDDLDQVTSADKTYADGNTIGGAQFDYSYDSVGNRKSVTRHMGRGSAPRTYTANALNQYTRIDHPGRIVVTGESDPAALVSVERPGRAPLLANRHDADFWCRIPVVHSNHAIVVTNTVRAVKPNSSNSLVRTELRETVLPPDPQALSYDLDGNLIDDGVWQYEWNAENRLVGMSNAEWRVTNQYDYKGRRCQKVVDDGSTVVTNQFTYDGWNLIQELTHSQTQTLTNSYVWGLDLSGSLQGAGGIGGLLAVCSGTHSSSDTFFPSYDGNGNVVALTDTNGSTVAEYAYSPFGRLLKATGPAADQNLFRFSTKHHDPTTGLYYYGYRHYSPTLSRWLNRDPIGERGGVGLYGFVGNSGVNLSDPLGLAGYFFDGTGNDKDEFDQFGMPKEPEAKNAPSHVAALYWMYTDTAFYEHGVGTRTEKLLGNLHGKGARERLDRMFRNFEATYDCGKGDTDIDIFGFSRGAAMAREFVNMIHEKYPEAKIRYLGIFDTVAQVGAPDDANRNPGVRLAVPSDSIGFTAHAVAKGEWRSLFPLTSIAGSYGVDAYGEKQWGIRWKPVVGLAPWRIPRKYSSADYRELKGDHYWEKPFEGAHSDIGGGYGDGTNLEALKWMYERGLAQGVPLAWSSNAFQKKKCYRMARHWHDSRYPGADRIPYTDIGRYTRRIYTGD